jgi:hypothetical protein
MLGVNTKGRRDSSFRCENDRMQRFLIPLRSIRNDNHTEGLGRKRAALPPFSSPYNSSGCHPEQSEGSLVSWPGCHPERSEGSLCHFAVVIPTPMRIEGRDLLEQTGCLWRA